MDKGKRAGLELVETAKPKRKRSKTAVKEGNYMLMLLNVLCKSQTHSLFNLSMYLVKSEPS